MATNAEIAANVALAEALGLTAAQMVSLCTRAIAELIQSGKPQVSYTIAGRTFTFANLATLKDLLAYYRDEQRSGDVPYVCQNAEF